MDARRNIIAIMKRELGGYFTSPVAYVFLDRKSTRLNSSHT